MRIHRWWFASACALVLGGCEKFVQAPLPPGICDIVLSPATVTLPVGASGAFTLVGSCSRLKGGMHWETAESTVAVVTAASDSGAIVTGRSAGTTAVIAWPLADPRVKGAGLIQVLAQGATCTTELRTNITALVRDSVTGAAAASGASGSVSSGSYQNTLVPYDTLRMFEGPKLQEHAGIYTVRISRPGYRDWVRSDVVVSADACHVHTVVLTVALVPASR